MRPQLTTTQWLSLSQEVRRKLIDIFHIQRSEGSHVQDNVVISDGHNHADLLAISVEKMQNWLQSTETDFYTLFDQVLNTIEKLKQGEVVPTPQAPAPEVKVTIQVGDKTYKTSEEVTPEPIKKRGRPAKTK